MIGFASILTVDLTGLLRAEAGRVWLFLQPWLVVPAGIELARQSFKDRLRILGIAWLLLVVIVTKLTFLWLRWPKWPPEG